MHEHHHSDSYGPTQCESGQHLKVGTKERDWIKGQIAHELDRLEPTDATKDWIVQGVREGPGLIAF